MTKTEKNGMFIQIQSVTKSFAEKQVIKNIDIEIEAGSFVAIVGRSGCGKSTLLRMLAGLEQATTGEILFDGDKVKHVRPDMRMLFQDARLLPWKTTLENVQLGEKDRDANKAKQFLTQVGLADKLDDWPSQLSGGQRQRVALARALVSEPHLLLLDEPLGALDALTRIDMQNLIEQLWIKQKFTTILVTHDVDEAVALADRVILIADGEIAFDINISLARPRERNNDFIHYEKIILDRILQRGEYEQREEVYSI